MRLARSAGIILAVVFMINVSVSATAWAELPEALPVPTAKEPVNYTFISGKAPLKFELTKGTRVECEKGKGSGSLTSARTGTATAAAEGCLESNTKAKCNTEGDAAGTMLKTEEGTLVVYKSGTELRLGLAGKLKENMKISCGIVKIEVRGSVMGALDGVTNGVKTKTATGLAHETKGEQELKTCELPKAFCEGQTFFLEADFGKGFELKGAEAQGEVTFAKEVAFDF